MRSISRGPLRRICRIRFGSTPSHPAESRLLQLWRWPEDLQATAKAEGVEIQPGDSVLIRTGYGKFFEADRAKYSAFRPGPGESAARWLAGKKIFLTGDDQMSYEVVPQKGTIFPCHRILIADSGIYLVENLNLEGLSKALAEQKVFEFVLV